MKQIKYLNAVLTVIAACLVLITLALTGLIPSANATPKTNASTKFVQVPINEDGSINVRFSPKSTIDVNIESVDATAFYQAEPIEVKIKE